MRFLMLIFLSSVACVLNSCSSTSQPSVSESSASLKSSQAKLEPLEKRIVTSVERYRKAAGLLPMTYHAGMSNLARKHSNNLKKKWMKRGKRVLNHDGFSGRSNKILLDFAMSKCAENVAYVWGEGDDTAVRLSRNWMNSPGHKQNILKHWNYTGIGVSVAPDGSIYATQLFGLKTDFIF